ncbi:ABC transporter permease [Tessaracoccus coleopterorum]|uniref:ABC transporter permease n=1 Tax=Tessaracoccus coleopterorum TaxID=2714950 RepID=UPI001E446F4C|nr:hypothetical protein [Tessaracoccus coleopterorum]
MFFALPMAWLVVAPFDANPTMAVKWPDWTLSNFQRLLDNPYALGSIGNSLILAVGTMVLTVLFATLASYALSRVKIPAATACSTACCCSAPSSPAPPRWCRRSS